MFEDLEWFVTSTFGAHACSGCWSRQWYQRVTTQSEILGLRRVFGSSKPNRESRGADSNL